ncbi:MAG: outer membrane beta-barrel protein [Flavobacteriales bacterium]
MKFLPFLFLMVINASIVTAQLGFDVAAKGQFNSTWLINKNTYNAGAEQDYAPSWGSNYGMGFGLRMGFFGLGMELNWGNHNAEFAGTYLTQSYTSKITLKTFQVPLLMRFQNEGGAYVELGAQFNNIKSAMYTYDGIINSSKDCSADFAKSYTTALIGFGINKKIVKSIPLGIIFGLRLQYGIKDAQGVDALGRSLSNTLLYPEYNKTRAAAAGFTFGLVYTIDTKEKESGY